MYSVSFIILYSGQQLYQKLTHCYIFPHYPVTLRQLTIKTLPSYTSILCSDQSMHNYLTNHHTATCSHTTYHPHTPYNQYLAQLHQ
jgi:hypothetical protein